MIPYHMNPMGLSGLPYKRRLSYLESTGTQWIDTGIIPDSATACHYYGQATTSPATYTVSNGFGEIETGKRYGFTYSKSGSVLQFVNYRSIMDFNVGDYHMFSVDLTPVNAGMQFNFVNISTHDSRMETMSGTISPSTTCTLFGVNGHPFSTRVYSFSMTKNQTVLLDLFPVLDRQNVPCMFDKVSWIMFYNQGTGQFLYA